MDSPLILCLDGSTGVCSVALVSPSISTDRGGFWAVLARRQQQDGRAQARVLLRLIDEMLHEMCEQPQGLSAVVVGAGPGTFTGVRITVATARALALALSIPVVGVSTLAALAASAAAARPQAELIVPVIDARRGQVFYGLYSRGAATPTREPLWVREMPFAVCDRGELGARVLREVSAPERKSCDRGGSFVAVVGEDISLAPDLPPGIRFDANEVKAEYLVLGQRLLAEPGPLPEGARLDSWLLRETRIPAETGASPAPAARGIGDPGTPESVRPIYVRSPDADIHITKMRDPWAAKPTDA
jgi:tRNA threonylcarbamoyl adenosine modification protein YeaZ